MLVDLFVHQRLRHHRLILFIVAELAEAHQVNHHIALELMAVFHRQLGDKRHRLGIIAIDMKDRRFDHLENISAIQ